MPVVTDFTETTDTTHANHPTLAKDATFRGSVVNDPTNGTDHDYFEIDIGGDGFDDGSGSLIPGTQLTITFQPANGYAYIVTGKIDSYENLHNSSFIIPDITFLNHQPNNPNGPNTFTYTVPASGLPSHATLEFDIRGQGDANGGALSYTLTLGNGGGGSGGPLPNLTSVSINSLSSGSVQAGAQVTVNTTVGNAGDGDAAAEHIGYYIATDSNFTTNVRFIAAVGVNGIAAHNLINYPTISIPIPTDVMPGNYYIRAVADYDGLVPETNNNDNTSTGVPITITAGSKTPMDAEVTFISGITPSAKVWGTTYWTWNTDSIPATYNSSQSMAHKFGSATLSTSGTPGSATYWFDMGSLWTAPEKNILVSGLDLWSAEANIAFTPASSAASANVIFKRSTDGQANTDAGFNLVSTAIGSGTDGRPGQVIITIDTSVAGYKLGDALNAGTYGNFAYETVLHEEGHMLGLGHGGAYNHSANASQQQFSAYDTRQWTLMSYIDPWDTAAKFYSSYPVVTAGSHPWGLSSDGHDFEPTTPMILDILAAQRIYGPATSGQLAAGNQTFGFHTTITGSIAQYFDFNVNTDPVITIWDAGINNTLDLSLFTANATISLTPGTFTSANGMVNNIGVAYNTTIENAIGGFGDDTFIAGPGNHTFDGGPLGTDTIDYSAAPTAVQFNFNSGSATNGYGGIDHFFSIENVKGTAFNDTFTSGAGAVGMIGGAGNDTYYVNNVADLVIENANQGNDIVYSTVGYTLPGNVESLVLIQGAGAINGAGNSADNYIAGNSDNNSLDGKGGNDTLVGGLGNDIYVIDSTSDLVTENPNEGNDIVYASVDYTIGPNIESVVLIEGAGNINAAGNGTANALVGNSGNNTLDGKGGDDTMRGGAGNDIYFIDSTSDLVVENPNEGNDIVYASVDYTIGANVESVVLIEGAGNINAAGSNTANALVGNSGNNTLDGKGGDDTMRGGGGNDIYFVDSTSDLVVENPNEGNDIVYAAVDYTIGANVESLVLTGNGNINGSGSNVDNAIVGNSGNNVIDGKGGHDLLTGNAGNDTFVFANGQASGDAIADFNGNGASAGDSLRFTGFGTAAQGATFTEIGATNQWQIHSGLDGHNEVITLQNSASVHPSDYLFA
jgi:hypothetical protein